LKFATFSDFFLPVAQHPISGLGRLIVEVSWSHS